MSVAEQIKKARILVKNRVTVGFDSAVEGTAFFLALVPPVNLLFALWCKMIATTKNAVLFNIYFGLLRRKIGFGALRHLDAESKQALQALIQQRTSRGATVDGPAPAIGIIDAIREQGYAKLPFRFTPEEVKQFLQYCAEQPYFTSQVPLQGDCILRKGFLDFMPEERVPADQRYRCLVPFAGMELDFMKRFIESPLVQGIAAGYLREEPFLYTCNTYVSRAGTGSHYVMRRHRDFDGFNTLTLFIGWTSTSRDDGATLFVPVSHRSNKLEDDSFVSLDCCEGDVYAVDTFGLHCGNTNLKTLRLATWIRFGSLPNLADLMDAPHKVAVRAATAKVEQYDTVIQ